MAIRVYADTSVFGGVFDAELQRPGREFFTLVSSGTLTRVTSSVVAQEIDRAPGRVQTLFRTHLGMAELVRVTPMARDLANAYLGAAILTARSRST